VIVHISISAPCLSTEISLNSMSDSSSGITLVYNKPLSSFAEISALVDSISTGDIIVTTNDKGLSFNSFMIQTGCNSPWTHSGMVIVLPNSKTRYLWESVNQHENETKYTNPITQKPAAGKGVRLIPLEDFLFDGLKVLQKKQNNFGTKIGVLKIDREKQGYTNFTNQIIQYVTNPALHNIPYPHSYEPLIESWWDGPLSLFVCFGCYTTFEVEEMKYQTHSPLALVKHQETSAHKTFFCSELVIATLNSTTFFNSYIPCNEWTVADIACPLHLNKFLSESYIAYENSITIYNFSA
jgi:hypothetical protein